MADPIIPLNQQESFPIVSVTGAQQATDTRIVGGAVLKYWGPAATGVTAAAVTTDVNGHVFLASNFLDMTGVSVGAAVVSRTSAIGAPLVVGSFNLWIQYRLDKTTVMPTSNSLGGGSINLDQCGMKPVNTSGYIFAASTAPLTEYALLSWGPSTDAGSGVGDNLAPVTIVSDVRFFVSFGTNPVAATNIFSLSIWGSS